MGFAKTREVPCKVVIVDGIRFLQNPKTGYYSSSEWQYKKGGKKPQLHVYVWEKSNGCKVQNGYDVHHKDFNKDNNAIDNLIAIPRHEHQMIHVLERTPDRNKEDKARLIKFAIPLAVKWHKSEEGREWHRKHAKDFDFGTQDEVKCKCSFCGNEFLGKENSKFCSNAHKSAWRRKMRLDDVDKTCEVCGKVFRSSKYDNTKTCSRECWITVCGRPLGAKDKSARKSRA